MTHRNAFFLAIFLFILKVNCEPDEGHKIRSFTIDYDNDTFLMDGKPFRYVSGEMHYFRTPHQYWWNRLKKIRAAGLNVVSTYVEWSFHEPIKGQYLWEGDQDLENFIATAQEQDLYVILRPGPYICAERDNGGIPYWLFQLYPGIKLRSSDENYKKEVAIWYDKLMSKMQPYLYGNGGPIIMVQVENEYGSFSPTDHSYMAWLKNLTEKYVSDAALLYTTDGPGVGYLEGGTTPGAYATIDFGPGANVNNAWKEMRVFSPKGPYVNSEFYPGWLTHWGEGMAQVSSGGIVKTLDEMLKTGASVNFYMFHGGTNFGFTAGANFGDRYMADITSYDYDAPITEAGDLTEKYLKIRDKVGEYLPLPDIPLPKNEPKGELKNVILKPQLNLLQERGKELLGKNKIQSKSTVNMEVMGQGFGFILYETIYYPQGNAMRNLTIKDLRDRAYVYIDSERVGILDRATKVDTISICSEGELLQILVENQGRINYGIADDIKGIIGEVTLDGRELKDWTITSFPLDNITDVNNEENLERVSLANGPVFYTAEFVLKDSEPYDTFLDTTGWGKGVAWINGRNLGRYWPSMGPQKTLYIPGVPYLETPPSTNILTLMELEAAPEKLVVNFQKEPMFN